MKSNLAYNDDVNRIWKRYHRKLTGSDDIRHDAHGNLFGFIAKAQPNYQSEILNILYESGYEAGVKEAFRLFKIGGEVA